jgi:hypothetical protein
MGFSEAKSLPEFSSSVIFFFRITESRTVLCSPPVVSYRFFVEQEGSALFGEKEQAF